MFDEGPERMVEKEQLCVDKTSYAWIEFAHNGQDDTVFYLQIGGVEDFARALFPNPIHAEFADAPSNDGACILLKGANVSGIASLFSAESFGAIEASNLRSWEKERGQLNTTDCVTMKMFRAKPSWALLIVRVGVFAAYAVSHRLCH
jgi:hypothetical protein